MNDVLTDSLSIHGQPLTSLPIAGSPAATVT